MGVSFTVDLLQPFDANMRVDLGAGEAFMAENLLDNAEIRSSIKHMRGKRVTQRVGRDFVAGGQCYEHVFLDDALYASGSQGTSAVVYEDDVMSGIAECASDGHVILQGTQGIGPDGNYSFLVALTQNTQGLLVVKYVRGA